MANGPTINKLPEQDREKQTRLKPEDETTKKKIPVVANPPAASEAASSKKRKAEDRDLDSSRQPGENWPLSISNSNIRLCKMNPHRSLPGHDGPEPLGRSEIENFAKSFESAADTLNWTCKMQDPVREVAKGTRAILQQGQEIISKHKAEWEEIEDELKRKAKR
ncbi:hypothetical protein BST61_g10627 [Cercospora zeina]